MKRPRLTKEQGRQVRSLVKDAGYTRAEARELVLMGFGERAAKEEIDFDPDCPLCAAMVAQMAGKGGAK